MDGTRLTARAFSAAVRKWMRERGLSKDGAAKLLGVSRPAMYKYVNGEAIPNATVFVRALNAGLRLENLQYRRESLRRIYGTLRKAQNNLRASSGILYVRDPLWSKQFRIVAMTGVKMPEPMHGFVFPVSAQNALSHGGDEEFVSDVAAALNRARALPDGLVISPERRSLFGDFVVRECVRSCARLRKRDKDGEVDSILFVNFSETVTFDSTLKQAIRDIFAKLTPDIAEVATELWQIDAGMLAQCVRIMQPDAGEAPPHSDLPSSENWLRAEFGSILSRTLGAFGLSLSDALGTIHILEPRNHTLKLMAFAGAVKGDELAQELSLQTGQGVLSWVYHRQRAILIGDLEVSPYNTIYVPTLPGIRSEVAVPMIVEGHVVGTFNLEAIAKQAFSEESVRALWCAASAAADIFQRHQQAIARRDLLEIVSTATTDAASIQQCMNKLAAFLRNELDAELCEIFHYNAHQKQFGNAGASYSPFESAVRINGWSAKIIETAQPVWMSDILGETTYAVTVWNGSTWEPLTREFNCPGGLNPHVFEMKAKSQLGLPIAANGKVIGVAWVRYARNQHEPLSGELMRTAHLIAAEIALVFEALENQSQKPDRDAVLRIGQRLKDTFFKTAPLEFPCESRLEGYALHRPLIANVSGDFHALRRINDSTVGLFLADGEGHATTGLVNALPLMTVFELVGDSSGSARAFMDKQMEMANRLGIRGSGLYAVFTLIEGNVWVSATSAGHPPFLLVRPDPLMTSTFPPENSPALGAAFGYNVAVPLAEERCQLRPGDLLVAYTDGVGDVLRPSGILSVVFRDLASSPEQIAARIMEAAQSSTTLDDDATVVVIRVTQPQISHPDGARPLGLVRVH